MNHRFLVFSILLYLSSISVYAQVSKNDKKIGILDSVKSDYEEWLRNEPQKSAQHDSSSIDPMQSRLPIISPEKLSPRHPPISVVIMTPKLQTEMQLAYQSHWLEEQRKSQVWLHGSSAKLFLIESQRNRDNARNCNKY